MYLISILTVVNKYFVMATLIRKQHVGYMVKLYKQIQLE